LNRQKSIISDAASISAWYAVFDCPSIVAATIVGRQDARGAIFPRPARPLAARRRGGGDRLLHVRGVGEVIVGQHVAVVVRHHRLRGASGSDLLAADDQRNVDPLCGHRFQARFQLGALRRARGVGAVGVVDRLGNAADAGEGRIENRGG
jgi:hypothetical protein